MTKRKILIVEDESLVALDIQECLRSFDYEVVAIATSGKEALTLVEDRQPDLILMDVTLSGEMDGAETAIAIRSRFGLPVIFLTAFTDQVILDRARLALPYGYLVKPFQDRELIANIEVALYKYEQEMLFLKNCDWFTSTFSAFTDGLILIDQYKNIVFLNSRTVELTGWTIETVGSPLEKTFAVYEEETDSIVTDFLANEALSKGITIDFKGKTRLIRKDGHEIHIDGSITPITAPDGLTFGAVLVFQNVSMECGDVSPLLQSADKCAHPEEKPDCIARKRGEVMPENIVEIADDGTVRSFNSGAERVFGFKPSEIIGKKIDIFLPTPFYSFMHKDGLIYPIHEAINKMRIRERSMFIGLLCNIILCQQNPNDTSKETGHAG